MRPEILVREHFWFYLLQRHSSKLVTTGPTQECTVEYIHPALTCICTFKTLFAMPTYMHLSHSYLPIKPKVCTQWVIDSVPWLQTKATAGGWLCEVTDAHQQKIERVVGGQCENNARAKTFPQAHREWALPASVKRQQCPQIIAKPTELQLENTLFPNTQSFTSTFREFIFFLPRSTIENLTCVLIKMKPTRSEVWNNGY